MKINVDEIPPTGLSLELTEDGKDLEALAGGLDFSILSPVKALLNITAGEGDVYAAGTVHARVRLACGRCLKLFESPVDADFTIFFERAGADVSDTELKSEDIEVNLLDGSELDTNEILLAQISLEMPMSPRCSPECKGLCQRCGADINLGHCKCPVEEKIDPRLSKLKDFKV